MAIYENTITGKRYEVMEGTLMPDFFKRVERSGVKNPPLTIEVEDKTPDVEPIDVKREKPANKRKGGKNVKN